MTPAGDLTAPRAARPLPVLGRAALVAAVVVALAIGAFALLRTWTHSAACEGGSGWRCFGTAVVLGVVAIPAVGVLLGWAGMRALGVPRAFVVSVLTPVTIVVLATGGWLAGTPMFVPLVAIVLVAAGSAAVWTWVVNSGRPRVIAGALALLALAYLATVLLV